MGWGDLLELFIKALTFLTYLQEIAMRAARYIRGTDMYMIMTFAFEYTKTVDKIKKWIKK